MLKNIPTLLSPDLLKTLRAMGHGDEIAIVDGNYPADEHGRRVLRADGISATDMLDAILTVMPLDDFVDCAAFRLPRAVPERAMTSRSSAISAPSSTGMRARIARWRGWRLRISTSASRTPMPW